MTKKQLKREIKKKFGSITKFSKLSKIDRYVLQLFFATPKPDSGLTESFYEAVKNTENTFLCTEISDQQREQMRIKIMEQYGSVYAFCKENKQFSRKSVYTVLNKYKRVTPMVKEIFTTLGIDFLKTT